MYKAVLSEICEAACARVGLWIWLAANYKPAVLKTHSIYMLMPTYMHGIIVDKAGNQEHPVRGQLHIEDWAPIPPPSKTVPKKVLNIHYHEHEAVSICAAWSFLFPIGTEESSMVKYSDFQGSRSVKFIFPSWRKKDEQTKGAHLQGLFQSSPTLQKKEQYMPLTVPLSQKYKHSLLSLSKPLCHYFPKHILLGKLVKSHFPRCARAFWPLYLYS